MSDLAPTEHVTPKLFVAGVGASAGGITALRALFAEIEVAPNLAFVVVQHMTHDQPSQLTRLFTGWTRLQVREATDGAALEPGVVYIGPAGQELQIHEGRLSLRPISSPGARAGIATIDALFESLASDLGERSIAVVLSGTGADGAAGAVRVKQAGGIVLVQDPNTAMHDGMPIAAIANGTADHVMPLTALAHELVSCAEPGYVRSTTALAWADEVSQALDGMLAMINAKTGHDMSGYKTTPLLWRIQQRMQLRRVPLFRDYEALLQDEPGELEALIRGLPIHVTEFFRDPAVWQLLEREVIPSLFDQAGDAPLRAWTPACSTGEEAYSLAMLFAEHTSARAPGADFQIFATDVSAEIVARASRGSFRSATVNALPLERRQRFFYAADGAHRIKRTLRSKLVFAPQDLLADPPFTGLDLITCRNLLIYLDTDAAERATSLMNHALRLGGYLVLGQSESLPLGKYGFEELAPGSRIFKKVEQVSVVNFDFPRRPTRIAEQSIVGEREQPSVLVDNELRIVRVYGDTRGFLRLRPGVTTLELLRLVPPGVGGTIQLAAQQARKERKAVTLDSGSSPGEDGRAPSICVTPLLTAPKGGGRLLVSFLAGEQAASRGEEDSEERVDWSDALRLSNADLDASREELQALNEELRASNDQLNVANESLSESNLQLLGKIEELKTQSDVLSSGEVLTLFLDEDLRVRFFTPGISELFPVQPGDVGRRISDLSPRFDAPHFLDHVRQVIRTDQLFESEVRAWAGHWYLMRIRPFRTGKAENRGLGVAVNFTEVTDRREASEALTRSEAALQLSQIWLRAQKEAFQAAMNGAPLEASLGILVRAAVAGSESQRRCAFYIANEETQTLHHVVGMSDAYAQCVDGFKISPESLACGLAVATGMPVITRDVLEEPRWKPWTWLARDFDFRGCWSFPVETSTGKKVGSFEMYFIEPRVPSALDSELAALLTYTAAIIISRHQQGSPAH